MGSLCGRQKYTHSLGLPAAQAIVDNYNRKFGPDLVPEQVIVTSGTSPAMLLLFIGLLEQGDEVVMPNPHYACYPNFVLCAGGKPSFVYTSEDDGFRMHPEAVADAITPLTKAILINSPANPTGRVMSPREYRGICEAAGDVPVISGEISRPRIQGRPSYRYTDNVRAERL
jgi:aspartate/methionine/tyrosine aminotransferase